MNAAEPMSDYPREDSNYPHENPFEVLRASQFVLEASFYSLLRDVPPKEWTDENRRFMKIFYQGIESLLGDIRTARDGAGPTSEHNPEGHRRKGHDNDR